MIINYMRKKLKNKDNEIVINIPSLSIEDLVELRVKELKDEPVHETIKYIKKLSKKSEKKTMTLFEFLVFQKLLNILKKDYEK